MTLGEALAAFLLQTDANGRSRLTITQYRRLVGRFVTWMGEATPIAAVRPTDIAQFLVTPIARGVQRPNKPSSVNSLRTSLRVFFAHAHSAGMVPANPARQVRMAVCAPAPPRGLSDQEVLRLLDVLTLAQGRIARRDHLLIVVMLRAGLRIGSALGLDLEDIDFERDEIIVRTSKGSRPARVFMSSALRDHMIGYCAGREPGALFTHACGKRLLIRGAEVRVRTWFRRAGVHHGATAHSLRHTFATAIYRRTGDLMLVQRALGHAAIASTLVYARPREADVRDAVREM